jgi:hypothetical protein
MFDENADNFRARAEQGRKNAEFRDLYESIKLDIRDQADAGENKTTYKLSKKDREHVDAVVEHLTAEDFTVGVKDKDEDRPVLQISWEEES